MEAHWPGWHHHTDVSPFTRTRAFGGGAQVILDPQHVMQMVSQIAAPLLPEVSDAPEGMQIDNVCSNSTDLNSGKNVFRQILIATDVVEACHQTGGKVVRSHATAPVRKLSVNLIDTYKYINQVSSLEKGEVYSLSDDAQKYAHKVVVVCVFDGVGGGGVVACRGREHHLCTWKINTPDRWSGTLPRAGVL